MPMGGTGAEKTRSVLKPLIGQTSCAPRTLFFKPQSDTFLT